MAKPPQGPKFSDWYPDAFESEVNALIAQYLADNPPVGIPGKDGIDGKDGKDGIHGIDGNDGADGRDGISGTDGLDGMDGQDGGSSSANVTKEDIDKMSEAEFNKLDPRIRIWYSRLHKGYLKPGKGEKN